MPTFFSAPKQTPRVPTTVSTNVVATVPGAQGRAVRARAEGFRAALDPARGFLESRPLKARDADARRETRCPSLAFPFAATEEALAARAARRRGRGAAGGREARARKEGKKTFAFGATYDDIDTENVSATTAVHLAASLEYLMLDREAEACASRVAHAARARDWRERLGGVSGALAALAAAAAARAPMGRARGAAGRGRGGLPRGGRDRARGARGGPPRPTGGDAARARPANASQVTMRRALPGACTCKNKVYFYA